MSLVLMILVGVFAAVSATTITTKSDVFIYVGVDNKAFSENIIFEQPAKSGLHCAALCEQQPCCVTFTFDQEVCRGHTILVTSNTSSTLTPGARSFARESKGREDIRLVDGTNPFEGRVEIYVNCTWGTVCDDRWGNDEARVVCTQLGFPNANTTAWNRAHFGEGTGSIWLDKAHCNGTERRLLDCPANVIGQHNCGHYEDAGVTCQ